MGVNHSQLVYVNLVPVVRSFTSGGGITWMQIRCGPHGSQYRHARVSNPEEMDRLAGGLVSRYSQMASWRSRDPIHIRPMLYSLTRRRARFICP